MADASVHALNVFLLKSTVDVPKSALQESAKFLASIELKASVPFDGALFVAPQRRSTPTWYEFVQSGARSPLGKLVNASTSAVLFLAAAKRQFAFTFGHGRALLRPSAFERSFGLRVVLNAVDPNELKSIDAKTVQELTVQTRRQVSRGSRLDAFSIDKETDLLRGVAGRPIDPDFARFVSGADALHLRLPIEFKDLGEKCEEFLSLYQSKDYVKAGFGFIDHVRVVSDPTTVKGLNGQLLSLLKARDLDRVYLAPPDVVDWNKTDGFSYSPKGELRADLDIKEFLDDLRKGELTVERLERQQIYLREEGVADSDSWSAFSSIVAEVDLATRRYVLSGGDWFEIDKAFADSVERRVTRIKEASLGLPSAKKGQTEGDYNANAAKAKGIVLCDKKCIREGGDPVELCDLYTSKRQFVHVKRWDSSATLSHLFAQGLVSAEAFLSSEAFRSGARKLLGAYSKHVPTTRPVPGKYEVVYAIIKKKAQGWRKALPFFSQLRMMRSVESLARLGYEPRVACIDIV